MHSLMILIFENMKPTFYVQLIINISQHLRTFLISSIYLTPTRKDKIITTFYINYKNIIYHLNIESPRTCIGIGFLIVY